MAKKIILLFFMFLCTACIHSYAQQTIVDTTVKLMVPDKLPEYISGLEGWSIFLQRNLDRDVPSKNMAPVGKYVVVVSFLIDSVGRVNDINVEHDPGYGTGKEVRRVVHLSDKRWKPAIDNGKPVAFRHRLSITFLNQ
ncbi:MAG: energy transducer TonB [Bacteroidota bacterium]